jgi:hypothetical protein
LDVLDRVLDKGVVIDYWARVSLVGIDLGTMDAEMVVASIDTYQNRALPLGFGIDHTTPRHARRRRPRLRSVLASNWHRPAG